MNSTSLVDLRVGIYFEPRADQPHAPAGPGWYIAATRSKDFADGPQHCEVVPRVRLSNEEAAQIAKVLDRFVDGKPLNWAGQLRRDDVSLEQAVAEAIQVGKEILAAEVAKAEAAAAQLERLRKIQEEFGA